ncbi:hypothetical protein H2509_08090 [Stappia sp. F7233]|uniref:Uncharacterized protein n=1 Tax=Stappia albiluteola TaxID=2758565 RepID=A0A839AET5_9HYPH|nr:hypothetical protein [Stappia albiluteola]MBA5777089.1 hypothetical protein [Stappia albiluteola]
MSSAPNKHPGIQERYEIDVWESEGGLLGFDDDMNNQYGRRVEVDGSWTVYHVFTGIPAADRSHMMVGMSRAGATRRMISLNLRNAERRRLKTRPSKSTVAVRGIEKFWSWL